MKKNGWVIIFFVALLVNITAIYIPHELLQNISKPMIIPALMVYFFFAETVRAGSLKKYVFAALLFSWIGDVLLMFQSSNQLFFLLGLGSFLVAHIFYIIFFHHVRIRESIKPNPWLLVIVVIYYAALINLLMPFLGTMKIPVLIYGVVISFMLMLALHILSLKNKTAGRCMVAGALLFVLSDSILAINKFYQPFEAAGVLIMLTYGLAQWFIVRGAVNYISSRDNK